MYPVFLESNSICGQLGVCKVKSILREPTCEECTGAITTVSGVIESPEKIAEIVAFLQVCCVNFFKLNFSKKLNIF